MLPHGASLDAADLDLPGGALIQGRFNGRIVCHGGSLVIGRGADFCGSADADRVYIEGRVHVTKDGDVSTIKGRRLVAVSEHAQGSAHLLSQAFAIHTASFSATFVTLGKT